MRNDDLERKPRSTLPAARGFFEEQRPFDDVANLDASSALLVRTLAPRLTAHSRKGVAFFSFRRWRSAIKVHQIDALRIVKRDPSSRFVEAVVSDIMAPLESLLSGALYRYVVPIPCTRSHCSTCLSQLMAERLASRMRLTPLHALTADYIGSGASHPKNNVGRAPMRLAIPLDAPAILIDDVATSGAHLTEGARLLHHGGHAVLPLVWINGIAN